MAMTFVQAVPKTVKPKTTQVLGAFGQAMEASKPVAQPTAAPVATPAATTNTLPAGMTQNTPQGNLAIQKAATTAVANGTTPIGLPATSFGPNFAQIPATPGAAQQPGVPGAPTGAVAQNQNVQAANPDGTQPPPKTEADNAGNPAAVSSTDRLYQDQLSGADKMWQNQQHELQGQMAGFQRQADSLNARMGGSIAGGYAGLAGSALGQGMTAYNQATNDYQKQRNDIMMKWAERKQTVEDRDKQAGDDNLGLALQYADDPNALKLINEHNKGGEQIALPGDDLIKSRQASIDNINNVELPDLQNQVDDWQRQINSFDSDGSLADVAKYKKLVSHLHNVKKKIEDAHRRASAFQWRIDNNATQR